ncbi:uncharacterized protein LOC110712546 [Chenopodium quinoa]|uniref:uncharacterized protein LOC110712546 n=1 Tax=Chenopodium quinoa TaxID=63459 RepID=UPI000B7862AF|nr:uncharacterized protein LOC110712546 [Chenopodium quinoa]
MPYASMASRRGPLQACGASMLAIALSLYKKATELHGPIGSVTRRLAKLGSKMVSQPLVYIVLYPWLAILFIVDDLILSMEKMLETRFPRLQHVFDKIDNLVGKVENLPKEFEYAMRNFPEEKEIEVDTNSDNNQSNQNKVLPSSTQDVVNTGDNVHVVGATCENNKDSSQQVGNKEASKKGQKENIRIEEKSQGVNKKGIKNKKATKDHKKKDMAKVDYHQETHKTKHDIKTGNKTDDHPLLEIFEFGWETPKSTMSRRRASYT